MNYIVLDLEWNQSPSGKEDSEKSLPFEIIEIGAVKLDERLRPAGEFHRLIKPQVYKQLHFKISEVTHMDMEELSHEGELFDQVMREFLLWCGDRDFVFCTWGAMDLTELQRNMAYYQVENPFPRPFLYYDVQKLYCLQFGDGRNRSSLDQAVGQLALEENRPFHRALDDAYYTGQVFRRLNLEEFGVFMSVDYYLLPRDEKEEYRLVFPAYMKYVSREFDSREAMMGDKRVTDMICCQCNRMLRKKIRWFPYGQRFYLCLAQCPEHGPVKGKIRVKKSEEDRYYAVKTMRPASPEDIEVLNQRKEDVRRKRAGRKV